MLLFLCKVFRPESQDEILLREEGCNTPGVCHQLSNEFELKHDRLSGAEDVKVKLMDMSPNLNLDNAPLLTCRPFPNVCSCNVTGTFSCVSHHSLYIVISRKVS
jgi:hypothetical protein